MVAVVAVVAATAVVVVVVRWSAREAAMQLHPEMLSWLYHEGRRTKGIHLTVFCMMIQYRVHLQQHDYRLLYRLQYTVLTADSTLYICSYVVFVYCDDVV